MLEARGLTKRYRGVLAVSDVTFAVASGEVLGYLGPNGSGKSTTLGMLAGLIEPSAGAVLFKGAKISENLIEFRRHVGYVPEEPRLYPFMSGLEHLELVAALRDMDYRVAQTRISALLELFGLHDHDYAAMSSYSKGMRQKVLISAALLHDPAVLIFDEPVSGLDATSALVFRHLLGELASQGKAVLYSSHELDAVEKTCSRVIVIHHGEIIAHDAVTSLRAALSRTSLEDVFQELVCDTDPSLVAKDLVAAMRLGA